MNIVQITPRLPPVMDGIGDYSLKLADGLLKNYGVLTHFLTCQRGFEPGAVINNFPVIELPNRSVTDFLQALPKNINKVILHFSEYPYDQKYGSPFWLVEALKAAKQQAKFKLLVMFHEFPHLVLHKRTYLFPLQSLAAWRLAKIADSVFTNNSVAKMTLEKQLCRPVTSIPVFSNVGEPEYITPLKKRQRRILVFGTPGRRARIYQRSTAMLINTCKLLEAEEIYDVGASLNLNKSEIKGVPLVEIGEKSAEEVSDLMLDSLAGIAYSNDNRRLTKSGVFATYCAHGLVPVITQAKSSPADGLEVGKHFLFAGTQSAVDIELLQNIANKAHTWYVAHSQAKNVEVFASQLLSNG